MKRVSPLKSRSLRHSGGPERTRSRKTEAARDPKRNLRFRIRPLVLGCILFLPFGGCRSGEKTGHPALTVFAAASLADAMQEIGDDFARREQVKLVFNFAGSGALAQQLIASPRADLFVSASPTWMERVQQAGRLREESRRTFLSNRLVVIAHPDFSPVMARPPDLATVPFELLALGDPASVPAGRYAKNWLQSVSAGDGRTLWDAVKNRISPAPDVRAVVAQVEGSIDVIGIVYGTDVLAGEGRVQPLHSVAAETGPRIAYDGAILEETSHAALAEAFLSFLEGPEAAAIFREHGFRLPDTP